MKTFVSATEFCRGDKSYKFCLICFFATCCCNKIMLQRRKFSQKFSITDEAICRCDVSLRHVATTCRLLCVGHYDFMTGEFYFMAEFSNLLKTLSILL